MKYKELFEETHRLLQESDNHLIELEKHIEDIEESYLIKIAQYFAVV